MFLIDVALSQAFIYFTVVNTDIIKFKKTHALECASGTTSRSSFSKTLGIQRHKPIPKILCRVWRRNGDHGLEDGYVGYNGYGECGS